MCAFNCVEFYSFPPKTAIVSVNFKLLEMFLTKKSKTIAKKKCLEFFLSFLTIN